MITPLKARFLVLLLTLTVFAAAAARADINVLILDGFSNHSVEKTTQKIQDILASDPRFIVSLSTMPAFDSEEWKDWHPKFADYDVVVQTCNNIFNKTISWPDRVKTDFEAFVRNGGGLYIYHSANNAFADWPEYNKMIGMGWRAADYGKAIEIKDGQIVEIPAGEGGKTFHGPRVDAVFNRFGDHPIHANLPRRWKSADVEIYAYTRGPAENLTVLSYALNPKSGMSFPTEWVVEYGKGRTYTSTYGHYWKNQENPTGVRDVAFQTLMMRAIQWLAKEPVTQTVPANFPTETETSLQDVPPRVELPAMTATRRATAALPTALAKRGKLLLDDDGSTDRGSKIVRRFDNGVGLKSALGIWNRSDTDSHVWRSTFKEDMGHPPVVSYPGTLANNMIVEVTFRYGENTEPWHSQFLRIAADQRPQINGHIVSAWVNLNGRYVETEKVVLEHVPGKSAGKGRGIVMDEQPLNTQPNTWYTAVLEIVDNESLFRMGDHVAYTKSDEITIPKNLVSLTLGTTWHEIKRVRIWDAEANPDWKTNKNAVITPRVAFNPRPR
ncbi:ThuA domain-containing protein [Opitutaceae bacterium]|nr:ThuA domain-containing protein [Opitutaceae bacterium]MDB4473675.1 ThuA domain-containing protein [Opitutaceae bacterium]